MPLMIFGKITQFEIVQNDIERSLKMCCDLLKKFTTPRSSNTQMEKRKGHLKK